MDANFGREPANQTREPFAPLAPFHAQGAANLPANLDANPRTIGREQDANQTNELRELLAREREFSAFLRAQLEEANRNAGELRAALREALRAMPKALPAPSPSGVASPVAPDERAKNASQRDEVGEAGSYGPDALKGAETREKRSESLSYGELADELERMLNR